MFIYKITVIPINKVYIGLDTKPSYKLSRWKTHCNESRKNCKTKLHAAIKEHGIENCKVEVVEDNFSSIGELALAEIRYIKQFDSYRNGLNSTPGGDGLGKKVLHQLTNDELIKIKSSLGDSFRDYNKNVKWANTTPEQRKSMVRNAFTPEVNARRRETLKQYYAVTPGAKESKAIGILEWQKNNQETFRRNNQINALKGSAKVSKKLLVEMPNGSMLKYASKSAFQRSTGQWAKTVIDKTNQGQTHNGYRAWEINE